MEIDISVAGHIASISCSTDLTNNRLCIALIRFPDGTPHLRQSEAAVYRRLKERALDELTAYLHCAPLVIEPQLPTGPTACWVTRRQAAKAATARST